MLDRSCFPAELILVSLRRLMQDHLLVRLWVLALGQSRKLFRPDRALESPLLSELASPSLYPTAHGSNSALPWPRTRGQGPSPGLVTGERFGDRQHLVRF
jgi:hypothetical protein